jgi:hypothetical protein
MAMGAMIRIIATTIYSSISEKPLLLPHDKLTPPIGSPIYSISTLGPEMAKSPGWAKGTYYQQMLQLCAADFEERPTGLLNFVRPL